jgi:hypothetical protein
MNSYTFTAESRRWWWPSAAAGVAASSAIAVIAMVPVTTYAASTEPRNPGSAASAPAADVAEDTTYRACFMTRPSWTPGLDGHQPRCVLRAGDTDRTEAKVEGAARGARRLEVWV